MLRRSLPIYVPLVLVLALGIQPMLSDGRAESRTISRIAPLPPGDEANAGASNPCISGDGHYVAFQSYASNYVPNDTNGTVKSQNSCKNGDVN